MAFEARRRDRPFDPTKETPKMGGERNFTHDAGDIEKSVAVPAGKIWRVSAASVASVPARNVDVDIDNGTETPFLVVTLCTSRGAATGLEVWSGEVILKAGWRIKAHWYSTLATDVLKWGFVYVEKEA